MPLKKGKEEGKRWRVKVREEGFESLRQLLSFSG